MDDFTQIFTLMYHVNDGNGATTNITTTFGDIDTTLDDVAQQVKIFLLSAGYHVEAVEIHSPTSTFRNEY